MSALDPAQGALGIVWCADPVVTVSEMKAGQQWNPGSDTTGVGTPDNPYATPDQCLKEIRIFEGQEAITKDWDIRFLTDDDENSTYPRVLRTDNTEYPETGSPAFFIIYTGWLKEWGATTRGKWVDINHKPIWGGYENLAPVDQGIRLLIFEDLTIRSDVTGITAMRLLAGDPPKQLYYHCQFQRISSTALFSFSNGSTGSDHHFLGCTFDKGVSSNIGLSTNMYIANCYVNNGSTGDCLFLDSDTGGGQLRRIIHPLNCVFICDGAGFYVFNNENGGDTLTKTLRCIRTGNTYHLINGGGFAIWDASSAPTPNFQPEGNQDIESQQVDPVFVIDGEPALANASPVFDKGQSLGGVWATNLTDPTSKGRHLYDARGFRWGDSITATSPISANSEVVFSHRSPGPIQQPLGYVPAENTLIFPVGIIGVATVYAVGKVGLDPDAAGTCQAELIQADDAAGTVGVVVASSSPINVTSTNKTIDISENGGPEVQVDINEGIYNTLEFHSEIELQLNNSGSLLGLYTVTYNTTTRKTTISATGVGSGIELKFGTGINASNSLRRLIGFDGIDVSDLASLEGQNPVTQNLYDSSLTWEFSSDYVEGEDPSTSGTWNPMGTGDPGDAGVEGINGVACDAGTRYIRVDIGTLYPVNQKHHGFRGWSGNFRSESVPL